MLKTVALNGKYMDSPVFFGLCLNGMEGVNGKLLHGGVEVRRWQAKLGCGCRTGIRISPMFFILTVELISNTEDFGLVFGRDVRLF